MGKSYVDCMSPVSSVQGLVFMWITLTYFLSVCGQLSQCWGGVWLLLEDLKPAQGVKRDFLLCTVGVLSGVESAPQLPEKSPECQDWAGFVPFDCIFCPKGGECWNKWVSRAHRGLKHCLCRHLQLHPNTQMQPRVAFLPLFGYPDLVQGCGVEWARLGCSLGWSWGQSIVATGIKAAVLALEVWSTLRHCLYNCQHWPLPQHHGHTPNP